ncbi:MULTISPECIES: tripartite tricarboxylate transporter substrate binding protein [unclassified Cupriavidus]|uniref:Bug family tripartite tricarboxylate transporter substrate binding protein n=1 Tax=unclassified Cupriavidus TaxID=2640874 RepID=UPI001C002D66|nr:MULTISPECIES: tripartite tricarboxylate transporter substrate binding protein [unclassified Cupriavidus]MCA3188698.1 tripartite tricarboxylate transporter substrate binding protein [Cupriavidus sp.]MCA3199714.1 tripartite tricarboxylate transporter substrate binding protein [Cupriavidus sp.]MCA3205188.1 tripartite tricarboxylate transporter substrate binding protein [Cupriavidus sp.]MCA3206730.1 tripartite tricarboxylate transporter substrate binding protein [Cupriavidus sp.]QWE96573.1 trip
MSARRLLLLSLALLAPLAHAAWPDSSKPIRVVVGFPPGGGADALARAIAPALSDQLKANVIIDNRPGAGGLIATDMVAKAAPDGYTLYIATPGSFTIWPNLRKLAYDPQKDFAPVSVLVTMPNVLVTGADTPYKDVQGLLAAVKTANGKFSYASGGNGTIGQIAAEQFKMLAGVQMQHVPYKGTTPALTDVMGGVVPITFSDPSAKPLIASGKLRVLAVTTAKRSPQFPGVPTVAEAGVPGYDVTNWYGLVAPAGTPPEVIAQLNRALVKVMADPEIRHRLAISGMDATSDTPQQFAKLLDSERTRWGDLIRRAGIQGD